MDKFFHKLNYKNLIKLYDKYKAKYITERIVHASERTAYSIEETSPNTYKVIMYANRKACREILVNVDYKTKTAVAIQLKLNDAYRPSVHTLEDEPFKNCLRYKLEDTLEDMLNIQQVTKEQLDEIKRLEKLQEEQDRMNQYELWIDAEKLTSYEAEGVIYILKVRTYELEYDETSFDKWYNLNYSIAQVCG